MTSREDNRRLAEAYAEAMGIGDTNLPDELTDVPDNFTHNYAGCQEPVCALCDAYGDGYTAGKEMAYFEVRNWHPQQHAPSLRVQSVYGREVGDKQSPVAQLQTA